MGIALHLPKVLDPPPLVEGQYYDRFDLQVVEEYVVSMLADAQFDVYYEEEKL